MSTLDNLQWFYNFVYFWFSLQNVEQVLSIFRVNDLCFGNVIIFWCLGICRYYYLYIMYQSIVCIHTLWFTIFSMTNLLQSVYLNWYTKSVFGCKFRKPDEKLNANWLCIWNHVTCNSKSAYFIHCKDSCSTRDFKAIICSNTCKWYKNDNISYAIWRSDTKIVCFGWWL